MNNYLDKGLFMMCYVGAIQIVDILTVNRGYLTFGSLWMGAIVLVIIGLLIHIYGNKRHES